MYSLYVLIAGMAPAGLSSIVRASEIVFANVAEIVVLQQVRAACQVPTHVRVQVQAPSLLQQVCAGRTPLLSRTA